MKRDVYQLILIFFHYNVTAKSAFGHQQEPSVNPVYKIFSGVYFEPAKWRRWISPLIAATVICSVQVENPVKIGYFATMRVNCHRNRIEPGNLKAVGVKIDKR